ncbi:hypothetical protein RRSWK_05434 [Rhodopirellula sp. SWK7]|nr:hypothetical protein RRSWK_05434 [Rhodopirellula sp. SWK7]
MRILVSGFDDSENERVEPIRPVENDSHRLAGEFRFVAPGSGAFG